MSKTDRLMTAVLAASVAMTGCTTQNCAAIVDPNARARCYADRGYTGGYVGGGSYYYGGGYHRAPMPGYDPRGPIGRIFGGFRGAFHGFGHGGFGRGG